MQNLEVKLSLNSIVDGLDREQLSALRYLTSSRMAMLEASDRSTELIVAHFKRLINYSDRYHQTDTHPKRFPEADAPMGNFTCNIAQWKALRKLMRCDDNRMGWGGQAYHANRVAFDNTLIWCPADATDLDRTGWSAWITIECEPPNVKDDYVEYTIQLHYNETPEKEIKWAK